MRKTMNRSQLLKELDKWGVKLSVNGDRLVIEAPKNVLTSELRDALKEHKPQIIDLLRQSQAITPTLPTIKSDPTQRYKPFPLTDIQQAYWLGRSGIFELGNVAINGYIEFETNNLDLSRLSAAWRKLIDRHDMLRAIVQADGQQRVLQNVPPYQIPVLDLRGLTKAEKAAQLEIIRDTLSHQILSAYQWPLFDIRATYLDDKQVRLHINLDLLMMDAASIQILLQEWNKLYQNLETELTPLNLTFRDYVLHKNALESPELIARSRDYWFSRLDTFPPAPELPLTCFPNQLQQPRFKRYRSQLQPETWQNLKKRGEEIGLTPSMILLTAFAQLLTTWSKNPHFTLNLTIFDRLAVHTQVNQIVGDFTNTILLPIDHSKPNNFIVRAQNLKQQLLQDLDHLQMSGVEVLQELGRRRKTGLQAIMPIVFTSILGLSSATNQELDLSFLGEEILSVSQTPQVWLDHQVTQYKGGLLFNWDVVEDLFPQGFIEDMFTTYCSLLEHLATTDSAWYESYLSLLPSVQLDLQKQVNQTDAPLSDQTLHGLFLQQVKTTPKSAAVIAPDRQFTYQELYQHARQLADLVKEYLNDSAIANTLVAVVMDKGWEQVVAVLGILMAGAAYVPIDPEFPQERQWDLFSQAGVKLAVTQPHLKENLSWPQQLQLIEIDSATPISEPEEPARLDRMSNPESHKNLAYVIYTSGSTGQPKGVAIDHRGAVNTILDINRRFAVGPDDRVLALSALNFDLSVYDIFGILAAGGAIVLLNSASRKDPAHWLERIQQEKVTVWNSVPALMQMLVEYASHLSSSPPAPLFSLRLVLLSGDCLPVSLPERIQALLYQVQVVSLGGATEASIWSIYYPIKTIKPDWKRIPYGKPLANQRFYILNELMEPVPVWVTGKLYIAGIGLAVNYWQDEAKTQASFMTHPTTQERLYKTGDLGRYLPDGTIEFLGREDFQVKIRGFRIELGEIEAILQEIPNISKSIVIPLEDLQHNKRLIAYIVESGSITNSDLRSILQKRLPEYMVPDVFVRLQDLPLTSNGKIDRKALPQPEFTSLDSKELIPPRNITELQLFEIWSDILNTTAIGVTTSFFDLGGNSFLAVRLMNQIQQKFKRDFPLAVLFQNSTIAEIAHFLGSNDTFSYSSLVPIRAAGTYLPLFLIHPFDGNVLCYQDLVDNLTVEQPAYGLQALGLNPQCEPHTKIEQMATYYIDLLKTVQPRGPYFLLGWSMGSLIAFEMAQQLIQQNESIAFLALLDPFTPAMMSLSIPDEDLALLALGLVGNLNVDLELLTQFTPDQRLNYVLEKAKQNNLIPDDFDLTQVHHLLKISKLNFQAGQNYSLQYYSGKIHLFKAAETDANLEAAWDKLAFDIEKTLVPGDHYNMLRKPHVYTLVQKLQAYLDIIHNGE